MKWLRSRRFWYVVLGIVPATPLVMFAMLLIGAPGTAVWFFGLAAGGYAGLWLATVIAPDSPNRHGAAAALLLMLCGASLTGTTVFFFIAHVVNDAPSANDGAVATLCFFSPTGIVLHYAWSFVQAERRRRMPGAPASTSETEATQVA